MGQYRDGRGEGGTKGHMRYERLLATAAGEMLARRCRPLLKRMRIRLDTYELFVRTFLRASFKQVILTIEVTHRCRLSTSCHEMAPYLFNAMRLTLLGRTGNPETDG
jgi:hypothetical protein